MKDIARSRLIARRASLWLGIAFVLAAVSVGAAADRNLDPLLQPFSRQLAQNPGKSGLYVLEKGEEALLARAWLTDRARHSIDVQYFIWSTDNIGLLAAEALLRAAERGVKVRVLVDDLMLDAAEDSLLALAAHPQIEIRIYNPVHKVGVSPSRRIYNLLTDFRAANQRMHDKTFIVDATFAITGGRNMADEYFDYDHDYNFRDRDALLLGPAAGEISRNFELFWQSPLSRPVETLRRFHQKPLDAAAIRRVYDALHRYAGEPANFAPEVRQALAALPEKFPLLLASMAWTEVAFVHDVPGKNDGKQGLGGGGESTRELAALLRGAGNRVTIQSPYLVLTEEALALFRDLVGRGVEVRICTNSLGATDNLMAFSGYRRQRAEILAAGIRVFEFRPQPEIQSRLVARYPALAERQPVFAIHAKTLVIDGETVFIGTFNLDPRSANLNTEVGVLFTDAAVAAGVEAAILQDMAPGNSWEAGGEDADAAAAMGKRLRLRFWELLPIDALL